MNKYLLALPILGMTLVQASAADIGISNSYVDANNPYGLLRNTTAVTSVDSSKEESTISYKDTTTEELETHKYKSVTVMNSFKSVNPTLVMTISSSPSKDPKDSTVIFAHALKGSTASCFRGCSLMVKFDDRDAKKYEFKSDITSKIYILDSSYNKDFIDNVKSSKVLKTKISFATFNLPIENIDFERIDF